LGEITTLGRAGLLGLTLLVVIEPGSCFGQVSQVSQTNHREGVASPLPRSASLEPWYYISDTDLAKEVLPAPPGTNSPEQGVELAEVTNVCMKASPDDVKRATNEINFSIAPFTNVMGRWFQTDKLPETMAFLQKVQKDTERVTDIGKPFWHRKRPYEDYPALTNVFKTNGIPMPDEPSNTGCPSGHSTRGTVFALLLSELIPDKQKEILDVGQRMGWNRVILGMHYPADVYAGRVLGIAIVRDMKANRGFQKKFNLVKAEIAEARKRER
jgi:acid phosphatase (class A)